MPFCEIISATLPEILTCRERGLLLLITSAFETCRFIPPLTISADECDAGLAVLGEAVQEVAALL